MSVSNIHNMHNFHVVCEKISDSFAGVEEKSQYVNVYLFFYTHSQGLCAESLLFVTGLLWAGLLRSMANKFYGPFNVLVMAW